MQSAGVPGVQPAILALQDWVAGEYIRSRGVALGDGGVVVRAMAISLYHVDVVGESWAETEMMEKTRKWSPPHDVGISAGAPIGIMSDPDCRAGSVCQALTPQH